MERHTLNLAESANLGYFHVGHNTNSTLRQPTDTTGHSPSTGHTKGP